MHEAAQRVIDAGGVEQGERALGAGRSSNWPSAISSPITASEGVGK